MPQLWIPQGAADQILGDYEAKHLEPIRKALKGEDIRLDIFRYTERDCELKHNFYYVLRANEEASSAAELDFFSSEAPETLRPRLRITYVPRRGFGLP